MRLFSSHKPPKDGRHPEALLFYVWQSVKQEYEGSRTVSRHTDQIDRSLGIRLREKRTSIGFSKKQLADKLQIDPKDIDLYESGAKRISADLLLRICKALGVRPVYFFGFSDERRRGAADLDNRPSEGTGVYLTLDQGLRLHRAFAQLRNPALREAIVTLVVEMAKSRSVR
jgi:transcriptional regulator with XRE-family HTH domain